MFNNNINFNNINGLHILPFNHGTDYLLKNMDNLNFVLTTFLSLSIKKKLDECSFYDYFNKIFSDFFIENITKIAVVRVQPGDLIFFDGVNDGAAIIRKGQEVGSEGISGSGRFTHVSIVVDVDPDTGCVLIAEGGGGGVKYLRQSIVRHLQTGIVLRPNLPNQNEDFIHELVRIACLSTLVSENELLRMKSNGLKNSQPQLINTIDNSIKNKAYKTIIPFAPFDVLAMLATPITSALNKKDAMTFERFDSIEQPGFSKSFSDYHLKETSFRLYCSKFALNVLLSAYIKTFFPDTNKVNFSNNLNKSIDNLLLFKNIDKNKLRYASPRTLLTLLLNKDSFSIVGSFLNINYAENKVNYYYDLGKENKEIGCVALTTDKVGFKFPNREHYIEEMNRHVDGRKNIKTLKFRINRSTEFQLDIPMHKFSEIFEQNKQTMAMVINYRRILGERHFSTNSVLKNLEYTNIANTMIAMLYVLSEQTSSIYVNNHQESCFILVLTMRFLYSIKNCYPDYFAKMEEAADKYIENYEKKENWGINKLSKNKILLKFLIKSVRGGDHSAISEKELNLIKIHTNWYGFGAANSKVIYDFLSKWLTEIHI